MSSLFSTFTSTPPYQTRRPLVARHRANKSPRAIIKPSRPVSLGGAARFLMPWCAACHACERRRWSTTCGPRRHSVARIGSRLSRSLVPFSPMTSSFCIGHVGHVGCTSSHMSIPCPQFERTLGRGASDCAGRCWDPDSSCQVNNNFQCHEPFAKFGSALGQPWVSPWERGRPARILVKALPRRQSAGEPTNPVKPIATTLPSLVRAGRPRSQGSQPFPAINPTYWRILQKALIIKIYLITHKFQPQLTGDRATEESAQRHEPVEEPDQRVGSGG